MKIWGGVLWVLAVVVAGVSCSNNRSQPTDTGTTGTIHISVDEAFKPIVEEQISVFQSAYPKAKIIAHYKPEADCWKDLMNDSIRMVVVTKNITQDEY